MLNKISWEQSETLKKMLLINKGSPKIYPYHYITGVMMCWLMYIIHKQSLWLLHVPVNQYKQNKISIYFPFLN